MRTGVIERIGTGWHRKRVARKIANSFMLKRPFLRGWYALYAVIDIVDISPLALVHGLFQPKAYEELEWFQPVALARWAFAVDNWPHVARL